MRESSYFEANILQVLSVLLDDLLNEVGVSGAKVRSGRLIELELEPPPQVWHMKHVVPAPADRRGSSPVHQRQMLKDLQNDVVGQVAPVLWCKTGPEPLLSFSRFLFGREGIL